MNAETLKALHGSIEKWERIASGEGVDDGTQNCPLCQLFNAPVGRNLNCAGCPVLAKTGVAKCDDTPYTNWIKLFDKECWPLRADTDEKREVASAELEFLRGLLP